MCVPSACVNYNFIFTTVKRFGFIWGEKKISLQSKQTNVSHTHIHGSSVNHVLLLPVHIHRENKTGSDKML